MTRWKRRQRAVRGVWLLAVLVVVVGSLLPAASYPMRMLDEVPVSDKVEHFGAYLVLALLPTLHERWNLVFRAILGLFVLGFALEIGQIYSPGRSFDLVDFGADAVGVCCGVCLAVPLRAAVRSLDRPAHRPRAT